MAATFEETGADIEGLPQAETTGGDNTAPIIKVESIWKVFGRNPDRALAPQNSAKSKPELQSELGVVVGLHDVSFEVYRGETFVIMGLSGSGKSTMVRCLIRLIEPTAGSIVIEGEDITEMTDRELMEFRRDKIAMVFQHYGLMPHRNVLENASWGLEVQGVPEPERHARAREVLSMVGLDGWEQAYPRQLSGGMQQRVGLARALVVDTDNPVYESGTEQWHTDFALRWSHYIGNWDLGASYFYGTSREPRFDPMFSSITKQGVTTLRPVYDIIHQAGVDVQGTFDAWLWKLEAIYRDGQDDAFFAGAVGLEYTFFDISGYGIDIGLVTEYLYDERNFFISTDNDLSLGMRLTLNDIDSTEFLAAVVQDLDNQSRYFFVEASRRIGDSFKLSVEARGINNVAEGDPLQFYDGDNFVQVELAYYF